MITKNKYLKALDIVLLYHKQISDTSLLVIRNVGKVNKDSIVNLNYKQFSEHFELNVRQFNYLELLMQEHSFNKIGELESLNMSHFYRVRNAGIKTVGQIIDILKLHDFNIKPL